MSNNMNPALLKELQNAEKSKFSGSLTVSSKDTPLTGKIFLYEGGVYAATVDGYYPKVVARMASSGKIDAAREEHLRQHFGGNLKDPEIGAYAVRNEWIAVDALSAIHQEYLLATLGALLTLPRVKVKRRKGESTSLFCTVPLPLNKVVDTLNMRASRFTGTWVPLTPNPDPHAVVPVIINAPALANLTAPETRSFASAIDGVSTVDQIASTCGYTRAEAIHLLSILINMGAVGLREVGHQNVDMGDFLVPEAAGMVISAEKDLSFDDQEMPPDEGDLVEDEIPAAAFGEVDEAVVEEDIEVAPKKEKRGLFGRRKKKEAVVEEEKEYNPEDWVTHELSEDALRGYDAPREDEAVDVIEDDEFEWNLVSDEESGTAGDWNPEGFGEMTEEIAVVEEVPAMLAPEPVWEPEPVVEHRTGLLTQWTQNAEEADKRHVRVEVLNRMVEVAKRDVEEKTVRLQQVEAELARVREELARAEEQGRLTAEHRAQMDAQLASLNAERDARQSELDAATAALRGAHEAVAAKEAEIRAVEDDIERLLDVLNQARARVAQLGEERNGLVEALAMHEAERSAKVDETAAAEHRVHEFTAGPHAEALQAEQQAQQVVAHSQQVVANVDATRGETDRALRLAQDVLAETEAEAAEASALDR